MNDCPFCKDLADAADGLVAEEGTCHFCGRRLSAKPTATQVSPDAIKTGSPMDLSAPSKPKDKSGSRIPILSLKAHDKMQAAAKRGDGSLQQSPRILDVASALAFFCGSFAICLASVPFLSFLTKPVAILGLMIGMLGLVLATRKRTVPWLQGIFCLLCVAVILFVGKWPLDAPAQPPSRGLVSLDKSTVTPVKDEDWADAVTKAYRLHNLRVQIRNVRLESVALSANKRKKVTAEKYLVVRLVVYLDDVIFKSIPYDSWSHWANRPSKNPPKLTDNTGQDYPQVKFPEEWDIAAGREKDDYLTPGRPVDDVLVFPAPPSKIDYLHLQLPAAAFGKEGEFKFEIPWSMVKSGK